MSVIWPEIVNDGVFCHHNFALFWLSMIIFFLFLLHFTIIPAGHLIGRNRFKSS